MKLLHCALQPCHLGEESLEKTLGETVAASCGAGPLSLLATQCSVALPTSLVRSLAMLASSSSSLPSFLPSHPGLLSCGLPATPAFAPACLPACLPSFLALTAVLPASPFSPCGDGSRPIATRPRARLHAAMPVLALPEVLATPSFGQFGFARYVLMLAALHFLPVASPQGSCPAPSTVHARVAQPSTARRLGSLAAATAPAANCDK